MKIAIVNYPKALKSAVFGLEEMFVLSNQVCVEREIPVRIDVEIINLDNLRCFPPSGMLYEAVILPPSMAGNFYGKPTSNLKNWLRERHNEGSILCSACAGAFIIAATGLLEGREATTHWGLASEFADLYPQTQLRLNDIIKNEGDIITAAGMMSWLDLGLELVAQMVSPAVMRQLGKILVTDTGQREQRFYQQFSPRLSHGDKIILDIQKNLQRDCSGVIKITKLASSCFLTDRTFLRRFSKATGLKPSEYIQRLRMQKACDLLENTPQTFEAIANEVGYEDVSACRKIFVRIIGLTPSAFKQRFVRH